MGLFSKAKENYDRRKDIAEYNYRAREYISEGQRVYENAYDNLRVACAKTAMKLDKYVNYKQNVLNEINRTLKKIDSSNSEIKLALKVDLLDLEACAVRQEEQLGVIDKALATWVAPSVTDLFRDVSTMDYYMAKSEMSKAKAYRDRMRVKRDELKNAKYAVQEIPNFIDDEKSQIEELMSKFRKTAESINQSNTTEKTESLSQIARLIADLLTTKFIDNNYEVTSQYMTLHNQISKINHSLADCAWLIGG